MKTVINNPLKFNIEETILIKELAAILIKLCNNMKNVIKDLRKQEKPDLPFLDGWNKLQDIGIDFHKIIKKTPGYLLDFKEDSSAYFALVYLDRIDIEDKRKKRKIKENVISKLKETINKNENLKESSKITTSRQNQSQKLKVNKINLN